MLLSEINRSVGQKTYMYQHVIFVKKIIYVNNKRKERHNKMLKVVIAGAILSSLYFVVLFSKLFP